MHGCDKQGFGATFYDTKGISLNKATPQGWPALVPQKGLVSTTIAFFCYQGTRGTMKIPGFLDGSVYQRVGPSEGSTSFDLQKGRFEIQLLSEITCRFRSRVLSDARMV